MKAIQAKVNPRLLDKAARLFTGTVRGRVIELLQNARRAGARRVEITNKDGMVIVRDEGHGIDDFAKVLDLGGSGWDEKLEESEDPAGVGLFCLAPRDLTIRSRGQMVHIREGAWTGAPVEVRQDRNCVTPGTELSFPDEAWSKVAVEPLAVFAGMDVVVDGEQCATKPFISGEAALYANLGCKIKVVADDAWRMVCGPYRAATDKLGQYANVFVDFHGQVTAFQVHYVSGHDLTCLVDLTGQPTGLRLMLPARTRLIENEAFEQLKAALELESFRHLKTLRRHRLPYEQWLRAKHLGVDLPEAELCFQVGLLTDDGFGVEPAEVTMPDGHPLANCYRLGDGDGLDSDEANAHLLAALGKFDTPFVPVRIDCRYDGYSWAKLPTIDKVEVSVGKTLQKDYVWSGQLICVDSLSITAHCSDGKVFQSDVPMAIEPDDDESTWSEDYVLVTPAARDCVDDMHIWHHLGGFGDEGDTYQTQESEFQKQMDEFWQKLAGPHEILRCKLIECVGGLEKGWQSISIEPVGRLVIRHQDGTEQVIAPPTQRQERHSCE